MESDRTKTASEAVSNGSQRMRPLHGYFSEEQFFGFQSLSFTLLSRFLRYI